jgi:hypothetical protein
MLHGLVRSGSFPRRLLSTAAAAAPQPDVIIVGAGIIGCSIALSLNRRGLRTLNLDKGVGAGSGSTCFSSGIIRTFYTARESAKFAWEGLHYWEEWADHVGLHGGGEAAACEGGLARMRTCGAVLPRTAASHDFLAKVVAHSVALGIPHEEWSAERAAAALGWDLGAYHPPTRVDHPDFGTATTPAPDGVRGAVHFPRTGCVSEDPLRSAHSRLVLSRLLLTHPLLPYSFPLTPLLVCYQPGMSPTRCSRAKTSRRRRAPRGWRSSGTAPPPRSSTCARTRGARAWWAWALPAATSCAHPWW